LQATGMLGGRSRRRCRNDLRGVLYHLWLPVVSADFVTHPVAVCNRLVTKPEVATPAP
jgi:hypothetical protein